MTGSETRQILENLRQRYPGVPVSVMLDQAQALEQSFLRDPVAAREQLISNYSRMTPDQMPTFKAPQYDHGVRGSIQRGRQDQADAEDLKGYQTRFGKGLPQILKQIEAADRGMIHTPGATSARLATTYGAPATQSDVPAYEAKQAAAKAHNDRMKGVQLAIHHGLISGDEADLNMMADVLAHPQFKRTPDKLADLRMAHEVVQTMKKQKAAPINNRAGSASISGGSPGGGMRGGAPAATRGKGDVRAALRRAMERA